MSPDVYEQVDVAVKKIDASLKAAGLSIGDVVKAKLYVVKGADPEKVRARFNETAAKLAPSLKGKPPAETLIVVEGLAGPALKFETSVIAAKK